MKAPLITQLQIKIFVAWWTRRWIRHFVIRDVDANKTLLLAINYHICCCTWFGSLSMCAVSHFIIYHRKTCRFCYCATESGATRTIKIKGKGVESSIFTLLERIRDALIRGLRKRRWCMDVVAQEAKSQSTLIGKLQDDEINCLFLKKAFCLRFRFQLFSFSSLSGHHRWRNFTKIGLTINHWSAPTLKRKTVGCFLFCRYQIRCSCLRYVFTTDGRLPRRCEFISRLYIFIVTLISTGLPPYIWRAVFIATLYFSKATL